MAAPETVATVFFFLKIHVSAANNKNSCSRGCSYRLKIHVGTVNNKMAAPETSATSFKNHVSTASNINGCARGCSFSLKSILAQSITEMALQSAQWLCFVEV